MSALLGLDGFVALAQFEDGGEWWGNPQLTDREREVLQLVADGCTNREIAQQLFLSQETVKGHLQAAFRKLGVANRTQAARRMHDQAH